MRPFYKILLLFGLMILSTTTVKAQTLIVDKANENYSENFDVPITIDSITFNSFKIKLSTLDPSLVINQVILNKKFSKGTLKFSSDGSIYTIDYTSESPIAIVKKEKIFDLKMGASDRFLDKNLITITQSDFYNTEKVLSVTEKVKPSTVNQFVTF
ncbi:hypothetical protein A9996_01955 [Gelidibacter algens]|uniref:hypothetical protein n=1 Tax=Gelidibacter algens TaxID=49280 RepID=UPI000806075F|nr:hypothetical protein [Gelidibacter algens]OBX26861.1 hypothetical protein A9996_01955 [Gelidibacter algens]